MRFDKKNRVYEFDSMSEYISVLKNTPPKSNTNESSKYGHEKFYGTKTYDEAEELALHGWAECAKRLTKEYDMKVNQEVEKYMRTYLAPVGYQAIVPLYLNGCPNNMVNSRIEVKKQKVISIVKSVGFRGDVKIKAIEEESLKTLILIRMLEKKGYRVNLYTLNGFKRSGKFYYVRVKVKGAAERLNISKLAFPLVHPSMLRRLNFRFREIFVGANDMGSSLYTKHENEPAIKKGEIFIPSFMKQSIDDIKDIFDMEDGYIAENLPNAFKSKPSFF